MSSHQCPLCKWRGAAWDMFVHIEYVHGIKRKYRRCVFCSEAYLPNQYIEYSVENVDRYAEDHLKSCTAYAAAALTGSMSHVEA